MNLTLTVLAVVVFWFQGITGLIDTSKGDSSRLQDTIRARSHGAVEQPITFPDIEERLKYLGVAIVAVGGLAALLDRKRREVDREIDESRSQ